MHLIVSTIQRLMKLVIGSRRPVIDLVIDLETGD